MGNISADWTPLKYQLGSDLNSISKKSRQRVIQKPIKAINTVLEDIAPGQLSSLKEKCFQLQKKKKEETQLLGCWTQALNEAPNRNAKIQLLSIPCGKDADDQYVYKQNELVDMFEGITLNDIKKARQHAAKATPGAPVEPGKFCRKRSTDAQINHFLDFLQYGGVMQDVESGTRTVKLSTGRKTKMPNAVRTVHKTEAIRLYLGACEMEGYTQENGRPSERTLWNILNNCPASQRKSLADLDNAASDGSDSFNRLIKICKTLENKSSDNSVKELTECRRYLKGNYRAHCSISACKGIADQCMKYALSDEKESSYKSTCGEKHDKACLEYDSLSQTLMSVKNLITNAQNITENERKGFHCDATQSVHSILQWKVHILTTNNEDIAKQLVLERLDDLTAFIVIDFFYEVSGTSVSRINEKLVWKGWE